MKLLLLTVLALAPVAWGRNVVTAGEALAVDVPGTWKAWIAVDIDGKEVARGNVINGHADAGKLPVGYYELKESGGTGKVTAGVVETISPEEDTPIALDASMAWFYSKESQTREACKLCRLAGVKWVRDRGSWPEIETASGVWAPDGRYEKTLRIEHDEGLKVLQINHISPTWASKNGMHFPDDLRTVHDFYRGLVKRWAGLADAIEPWNEPDIKEFGGHTGSEIASFDKAAYWGFKAGNPNWIVNDAVFAIDRPETLEEFGWNDVWPYFDRYDLHHYIALPAYPRAYGRHREQSGGRPMWTTEFNLMVKWANPKTHEPSEQDLRVQAWRVGKVFATALNEGPEKLFYFILGNYVERDVQYGLIHDDMTPRPAYVALSAVGRFLDAAKPIGQVDFGDPKLKGFLFDTVVDGQKTQTLVAWSETKKTQVNASGKVFDCYGRQMPAAGKVELGRGPVFVISDRSQEGLKIIPAPKKADRKEGKPSPIVLQLLGTTDFTRSGFEGKELKLAIYNFGQNEAKGKLNIEGGSLTNDTEVTIPPGERQERTIHVEKEGKVLVKADMGNAGQSIVAARALVDSTTQPQGK